ncbi:MAG: hypothetical protein KDA46_04700, partial [Parvularculaceae bacterium]|nr:hypothetical protein [Parvularculaceae bacterium]
MDQSQHSDALAGARAAAPSGASGRADADRGSSFAAEMTRDAKHREKSRSIKPLMRLAPFVLKYKGLLAAFVFFLILASALTLVLPAAFRMVVDCGFGGAADSDVCARVSLDHNLTRYFALGFVVAIALGLASACRFYFVSRLGERVVADIRSAVYDHLLTLSPSFYVDVRTGEVLSRLTTDTSVLQTVVGSSLSMALRNVLLLIGGTVMLAVTSPKLTGIVFLLVPVVMVPIIVFGRRVRRMSRLSQDRIADVGHRIDETLNGMATVQAFAQEAAESRRFAATVEDAFNIAVQRIRARALLTATVILLVFGGISGVLWMGGHDVLAGRISGGDLAAFVFYAVVVAGSVGAISEVYGDLQRAAGAAERLVELLNAQPAIAAPADPVELPGPAPGAVAMENVRFAYPAHPETAILDGFDLKVAPGETVALV